MIGPSETKDYNLQFIVTSLLFVERVDVTSHGFTARLEGPGLEEDCFVYHFENESDMIFNLLLGYLGEPIYRGDLSPVSPTPSRTRTSRNVSSRDLRLNPVKTNSDRRSLSTSAANPKQVLVYLKKKGITIDVFSQLITDLLNEVANASTSVEKTSFSS
jgi:hypothetical protein